MAQRFGAPDGVQLVLQFLFCSSALDEFLDFFQLVSTACFEPAGIMEDETVSCRILKLVFDIVFSALKNYTEYITTEDTGRP